MAKDTIKWGANDAPAEAIKWGADDAPVTFGEADTPVDQPASVQPAPTRASDAEIDQLAMAGATSGSAAGQINAAPAPDGNTSAIGEELGQLRDEFFTGVDNTRAALKTVNVAAQANQLQQAQDKLAALEGRGAGGSPEAAGLRKTIEHYSARMPEMIGGMTEAQADAQRGGQMTTRPAVAALNSAKSFGEAWDVFKSNPYDVIAGVSATSLPTMLPALVTGAVMGPAAGAITMGGSSAATEAGSSLADFAQEAGVDTTNPQQVQAFFEDRKNLADAMAYAGKRAGIIGALDMVSGGVAGKTLAPAVLKSQIAKQAVNLPAQMAVQAGLGAGGEAGGQLATKGTIDQPGQVLAEAAGELAGAPSEVVAFSKEARSAIMGKPAVDPRVQRLRDAGEKNAADLLEKRIAAQRLPAEVDRELTSLQLPAAQAPEFQNTYRSLRTAGVKPAEAAARTAVVTDFRTAATAAGMSEKAIAAALDAGQKKGLDELPTFLHRFTQSLASRGAVQAVDMGPQLEAARDAGLDAAMESLYGDVQDTMSAVQNIERILGEANDSPSTGVQGSDTGTDGSGVDLSPASLGDGVRTDGAQAQPMDTRGDTAVLPVEDLPQPAGPGLDALRTENAALRNQAIQALQSQQVPAAQAEQVPALRSDVPAEPGLPPAGPAAVEERWVAVDQDVTRQLADAGLEMDDGVTPGKWSAKVGGLGDVMVDITSRPGEPVRATVRAQYMGKDYAQADAEGMPAILANVQKMRDGIQEFRQREAQKLAANGGLTETQAPSARQVALDAERAKLEATRSKRAAEPKPVLALSPDDGRKLVALRNAGGKFQAVDDAGNIIPESPEFDTGPEADHWRRMQAKPTADRRQEDRHQPDRRQDTEARKRVAEMSPEELRAALLTHELTGIQNRRAWEEAPKKAHVSSIDADSLKWINDNMSPESGDKLLQAVAEAMSRALPAEDIFHISGDEFIAQSDDLKALQDGMAEVQSILDKAIIIAEKPDGSTVSKQGLSITHAIGGDKNEADLSLKREKQAREQAGLRAARGETPPGVAQRPATGKQDQGGQAAEDLTDKKVKVAPTPDTSEQQQQGRPGAGMQERPAVRAVSGSLAEPAQSGGGAGSNTNVTGFSGFVKQYRESQPLDTYEHNRELERIASEIAKDWQSGSTDELTRTYGPRLVNDQLHQENEAKYFDADGDQTPAGDQRYAEIETELSERLAREYLGEPERKTIDLRIPHDAAKVLHAYLEANGAEPSAIGGSAKSGSQYFEVGGKKVRIGDHALPAEYEQPDIDLVLGDVGNDVRADGRMTTDGISEEEAQRRIAALARDLLPKEKLLSKMSAADLLRAAADKMEGRESKPDQETAKAVTPEKVEKPAKPESEPMFSRASATAEAVRAGDVFRLPNGEAVTALRQLPGGRVEVRIQGRRMRVGEFQTAELKKLERIGRAEYKDGAYYTPESMYAGVGKDQTETPAKAETQEPMFSQGQLPAVITPSTVERVQDAITELLGTKQLPNSLGRIVATTAAEIKTTWEPLIGKNLQIGSEGEAGIAQAFWEPRTNTVFMIADHINEGTETAVLAHELMHKHGIPVLGETGWNRLHSLIGTWKDAPEDSDERFVYDYASRKVEAVGQELSTQELFPYAVEAAFKIGVKPSMAAKRGTVAYWLESVRQHLKEVWGKITGKPETFKAQDLVDLAFGIAQMETPQSAKELTGALTGEQSPELFDLRSKWEDRGLKIDIYEQRNGDLNLSRIIVPKDGRNAGLGTEAMNDIIGYADKNNKRIVLSPSADFGGNKARLVEFYKRLGFVENKGGNKDLEISESMYRDPNGGDAQYSRSTEAEQSALRALSENDELFALPKSDKTTVEEIAAETDPEITVKTTKQPGLVQTYVLTLADGTKAKLMVRKVNPYGPQAYGMLEGEDVDLEAITERPGENPQDVPGDTEDVYIDVSNLKEGGYGSMVYNIAATYAHNTGRILIGDPAGLSDDAMRRRTENMLSSALKFGTTRHLAPHPRQTMGGRDMGVPPMRWTYGDDLGNIQELIRVSNQSLDYAGGNPFTFDASTGTFRDSEGGAIDDDAISLAVEAGAGRAQNAGVSTLKRNAVLSALVREEGGQGGSRGTGAGILARLVDVGRQHAASTQGIFYSRGAAGQSGVTPPAGTPPATAEGQPNAWNLPAETRTDRIIYELQDGRVDLKRVQQAIEAAGRDITEQWDARLAETLYPGRVSHRSKQFLDAEVKPLLKSMAANKVDMAEISDYLHARGAEERNAQIAKVNPDMPDGGAGKNSKGVLMTNQAARDYLDGISSTRKMVLDAMAKHVDAITAGTRKLLVDSGLEKQETIDAWQKAYKNYVPMFRDEAASGAPPHPQGAGFSVRGSSSRRATGSTKEVTNMLAHVLMQREAAITRAEKNRVALALYGQALSHPNPEFWTTIRPGMSDAKIEAELVAMGVDPAMAALGMERAPTIRTVDETTGKVIDRPNPLYRNLPGAIPLKVAGEDRVLMLNTAEERGQRLAESLKNLDGLTRFDLAGSIIGKTTRWLAAVNTQYNPAFGLVNLTRDTLGGVINLGSTELRGKSLKILADTPGAIFGIARELATGKQTGKWGKLYRQFVADGGQTGYKELWRDPYDRARAIEKELKAEGRLTPGKAAHAILDVLDGFNTTLENAVRLAAYSEALDKGMSRAEAARLGRELTVDFNRKGRAGRELGPLYAFFNASVQGAARTIQTLKGPTGAKIIAGGLSLGILQALMLAAAGYDDDELPEFSKARALIIPLPGDEKKYIAIPYPLGLHVIPNTGRVLAELMLNGGKDIGKRSAEAVGEIAAAFNPLGGGNIFTAHGALTTIAPTAVDPIIDLAANKNFAGTSIERQGYGSEADNRPGAARARESTQRNTTGQVYLGISKAINAMTGGTDYEAGAVSPTPERLRYLAQTVGGGLLREIEKGINASTAAARGDKVKANQIPVIGRFYGESDEDRVQTSRYFENKRKVDKAESSFKAMEKAGDAKALEQFIKDHPEVLMAEFMNKMQRDLSELNRLAVTTVNDTKMMEEIDAARAELMKSANSTVKEMESMADKQRGRGPSLGDQLRARAAAKPAD